MQHPDIPPRSDENVAGIVQATADSLPYQPEVLTRARAFVQPLLANMTLPSGENTFVHAEGVARILAHIGSTANLQAAAYLVYAAEHLNRPQELIEQVFGKEYADLALEAMRLMQLQRNQRMQQHNAGNTSQANQIEVVRKMLLAFSRDLRVILLRLASRLQTLRYLAASKTAVPPELARESLHVLAPLANRLGIWQIKWELEDLAFRFLEPQTYRQVAQWLDEKREQREQRADSLRQAVQQGLAGQGVTATVQARPKHIYSIVKKMRGKALDFSQIYDVMALRVIVKDVKECYTALSWIHSHYEPVDNEFDDYIARPKANGYQSLHTVVQQPQADGTTRPVEFQIRTQAMHEHAETGVAAHWAYKEAGAKGYAGHNANSTYESKIAVLRQLLAWERDLAVDEDQAPAGQKKAPATSGSNLLQDRIYVFTPDAAIVELPQGATPVDFAYTVHTTLGHRCRGARVDGAMVPLNTPLQNGQTVEITAAKEGGPSRDWLNTEQGYLASSRARAKVRAWFNALAQQDAIARGREAVEKLLQREGKTAVKLDDLAGQLGFSCADDLFEVVGKDEFSLRNIEAVLRPQVPAPTADEILLQKQTHRQERPHARSSGKSGVLVVGMGSLMTQLGKCCKPAPPDAIGGFVTRGKGVSVHRIDCVNFRNMVRDTPERAIDVQWSADQTTASDGPGYPVDVLVQASNRPGLLRDITELFARDKMPVIGLQSEPGKNGSHMTFTVQVANTHRLRQTLNELGDMEGVIAARRR
ncbi:MAG: RelA/SpoT family protein [Brachymonas sp.]